jgi:hypothetical protein
MSKSTPAAAPHVWNDTALLSKARRYVEQMQTCDHDDWRFAFWSSLALELIARASLAKVSPVLLADSNNNEWTQLYFALGYTPTAQKFIPKSAAISDVLTRLQAINPTFEKELRDFCSVHIAMRNAELHSAEMPFEDLKASTWLWKFYRSCEVHLASLNVDLINLLGPEQAAFAKQQIDAAKDEAAKAVLGTIKSFKEVWEAKPEKERNKLTEKADAWASRQAGHIVDCPACSCEALLGGDPIAAPKKTLKNDVVIETQAMAPSQFQCVACGLKINGLSQLSAAGLGSPFKKTATYNAAEYFYPGDDEHGGYEDDNNEPLGT